MSSDEFLNYAINNRAEWERKGPAMVEQYVKNYEEQFGKREQKPEHQKPDEPSVTASLDDEISGSSTSNAIDAQGVSRDLLSDSN